MGPQGGSIPQDQAEVVWLCAVSRGTEVGWSNEVKALAAEAKFGFQKSQGGRRKLPWVVF